MKKKDIWSLGFILCLIAGNFVLVQNTVGKMNRYPTSPPFRLDDYTNSYRVNSRSQLNHIMDSDMNTEWQKLSEGFEDKDWDAEIRLTHFWNGEEFVPRTLPNLVLIPCADFPLKLTLLLREGINVDKELRLPDDFPIWEEEFSAKSGEPIFIPVPPLADLKSTTKYPEGIFILTLRGKHKNIEGCIRDLSLEENTGEIH